jgi:hypothetical protein
VLVTGVATSAEYARRTSGRTRDDVPLSL